MPKVEGTFEALEQFQRGLLFGPAPAIRLQSVLPSGEVLGFRAKSFRGGALSASVGVGFALLQFLGVGLGFGNVAEPPPPGSRRMSLFKTAGGQRT